MAKNAILIKTNGQETIVSPENGNDFKLKELQGFVRGLIEIVPAKAAGWVLIVNEEGKLLNMEVNPQATKLYGRGDDIVVGDVIYCQSALVK